jgi:DNA-binding XRE family transcriptional regulator
MVDVKEIAKAIRQYRMTHGFTLEEMAKEIQDAASAALDSRKRQS